MFLNQYFEFFGLAHSSRDFSRRQLLIQSCVLFPFRLQNANDHDAPACAAMEKFAMKIHRFILQFMFANSAAATRISSGFEFIQRPRLLGHPCQAGCAGGWFRQEKPLRFRAGPARAAQARPARENRADERRAARVARPRVVASRIIQFPPGMRGKPRVACQNRTMSTRCPARHGRFRENSRYFRRELLIRNPAGMVVVAGQFINAAILCA